MVHDQSFIEVGPSNPVFVRPRAEGNQISTVSYKGRPWLEVVSAPTILLTVMTATIQPKLERRNLMTCAILAFSPNLLRCKMHTHVDHTKGDQSQQKVMVWWNSYQVEQGGSIHFVVPQVT